MSKLNLNKRLFFLSPYFIVAIIFILIPMIFLAVKAFTPVSSSFNNFQLVEDSTTWKIMLRSIIAGLITAIVCLILGLPFTYWVSQLKSQKAKSYVMTVTIAPMFIFTLAKVLGLKSLFIFILGNSPALSSASFAITGLVYLNLPFMILPLYSVFETMPKSLEEASFDLGYNKFKTMIKVVIPWGWKGIVSGVGLVFMLASTSIVISQKLLVDPLHYQMIANRIVDNATMQNKYYLALVSNLALVTILVISGVYFLLLLTLRFNSFVEGIKKLIGKTNKKCAKNTKRKKWKN